MNSHQDPRHIVAAGGLVRNDAGEVLLIESARGDWEFPGGQVEEGESLPQALEREMLEETGYVVQVDKLAAVYSNLSHGPKVIFDFLCRLAGGEAKTSAESRQVVWVPAETALNRLSRRGMRDRLRHMLSFDGRVLYRSFGVDQQTASGEYTTRDERYV